MTAARSGTWSWSSPWARRALTADAGPVGVPFVVAVAAAVSTETARRCGASGAGLAGTGVVGPAGLLHAVDPVAHLLENVQVFLGDGPCAWARRDGWPHEVADLAALDDESGFAAEGRALGVRAVASHPVVRGDRVVATLFVHRDRPGPWGRAERVELAALADLCGQVLGARTVRPGRPAAPAEIVVEAARALAAHAGIVLDKALLCLRAEAFARRMPPAELARDVLACWSAEATVPALGPGVDAT